MREIFVKSPELLPTIDSIHGKELEVKINSLAEIAEGGKIGNGGSRLALSSKDIESRELLSIWMKDAGMDIEENPLGLIGTYPGKESQLPAIGMGSHFDTVPKGGRYDGTVGTITAIEVIKAFHDNGIQGRRPIKVFAFTGEESSRFNTALFGSKGIFHGLSDNVLAMKSTDDLSLKDAIRQMGYDPEAAKRPSIERSQLSGFIELHVEQGTRLDTKAIDVGIINAVAAPDRRTIIIGEPLEPKTIQPEFVEGLKINIEGKGGHSGATPMGRLYRADGILPASELLMVIPSAFKKLFQDRGINIYIQGVNIEGAALNKIPGRTNLDIIISGTDQKSLDDAKAFVSNYLEKLNKYYGSEIFPSFNGNPITFENLPKDLITTQRVFSPDQILPYFKSAGLLIAKINQICSAHSIQNVVGTVGTFYINPSGVLELGLDVRGIDQTARDAAMSEIEKELLLTGNRENVKVQISDPLPGSDSPTIMDQHLQDVLKEVALALGLTVETLFSSAGHDSQNVARAGIPTGMLFVPSRNGGVSHVPDEYSTPQDLENGAKVLAASVYELATE